MAGGQGDGYTRGLLKVDYAHHEVHDGNHYFIRDVVDQAINTVYDLQITVPSGDKWPHMLWTINAEAEVDFYVYEGVTIVNAGTTVPSVNSNRNSLNTSILTIKSQVNSSVGDANADTATAGATEIGHQKAGDKNTMGFSDREHEIILRADVDYCFRCVFTKAAYVAFDLNWYEHTNNKVLSNRWYE